MKNIKINAETIMILSEMIDKMEIKDELKNIDAKTNEEVGQELVLLLVTKLYKVKDIFYEFIINYKNIEIAEDLSEEEKHKKAIEIAKKTDAIEFFKELLQVEGLSDFLASK